MTQYLVIWSRTRAVKAVIQKKRFLRSVWRMGDRKQVQTTDYQTTDYLTAECCAQTQLGAIIIE
ncbi:MAG: hypothetical protein ACPGVO_19870, partial [Spirulinaceae cyanobacterium]